MTIIEKAQDQASHNNKRFQIVFEPSGNCCIVDTQESEVLGTGLSRITAMALNARLNRLDDCITDFQNPNL